MLEAAGMNNVAALYVHLAGDKPKYDLTDDGVIDIYHVGIATNFGHGLDPQQAGSRAMVRLSVLNMRTIRVSRAISSDSIYAIPPIQALASLEISNGWEGVSILLHILSARVITIMLAISDLELFSGERWFLSKRPHLMVMDVSVIPELFDTIWPFGFLNVRV
jgi:hypothetical protein